MKLLLDFLGSTLSKTVNAQEAALGASTSVGDVAAGLPFKIPSMAEIMTFAIRAFFVIAGLAALLYLILGAFSWVTSGGDKENVHKAQLKIQSAIIGLLILIATLAIMVTLEQIVFKQTICLGLTCPLTFPGLLNPSP